MPSFDITLNKTTYFIGDTITATEFRARNPSTTPISVHTKIWLVVPFVGEVVLVDFGSDGSFSMPGNLDQNLGPFSLLTVTAAWPPRGSWEWNVRLRNPTTRAILHEDTNSFVVPGQSAADLNEQFERSPGTDESYQNRYLQPGNIMDPDFPVSNLGSNPPWGTECALINIGPTYGGAIWNQSLTTSRSGFKTHYSFIALESGLQPDQRVLIGGCKVEGDPLGSVFPWGLYMYMSSDGSDTYLLFSVSNNDGLFRFPRTGSIVLGTIYNNEIVYDIKHHFYSWTVNGAMVVSAPMPASYPDNIGIRVIGSSASSTGRNTTYVVDRVTWTEIDP